MRNKIIGLSLIGIPIIGTITMLILGSSYLVIWKIILVIIPIGIWQGRKFLNSDYDHTDKPDDRIHSKPLPKI